MYCRECGKKVDQWVKYCPYCGAETSFPEEIQDEKTQKIPVKQERGKREEQKPDDKGGKKKNTQKGALSSAYGGVASVWLLICTAVYAVLGVQSLLAVSLLSAIFWLASAVCFFFLRKSGKFSLFYIPCAITVIFFLLSGVGTWTILSAAMLIVTWILLRGTGKASVKKPVASGSSTGMSLVQIVISLICGAVICCFLFQDWLGLQLGSVSGVYSLTSMISLSADANALAATFIPQGNEATVSLVIYIVMTALSLVGYVIAALEALHLIALLILRGQARAFGRTAAELALLVSVLFFLCYIGANAYLVTQLGYAVQSAVRTELAPIVVLLAAVIQRMMTAKR